MATYMLNGFALPGPKMVNADAVHAWFLSHPEPIALNTLSDAIDVQMSEIPLSVLIRTKAGFVYNNTIVRVE